MSVWKRGRQYWTDFAVAGQRYRKRLGTTNLQLAKKRERDLIENSRPPIGHSQRTRTEAAVRGNRVVPCRETNALLVAHDRARRGAAQSRQETLRRRATSCDHGVSDCRLPARPPPRRDREPHDQHWMSASSRACSNPAASCVSATTPEGVTSQSRHSLTLSGSPPSGKLVIPFERRDVRVVEGARLEIDFRRAC
jgi:hypothetical protein